jgi:pseudouridine-5'-phosphate glycosidase
MSVRHSPAPWCQITEQVRQALINGEPVVALESTLISHGLPYPDNLATAHMLETAIRDRGAIPATIAILNGVPRIGLEKADLIRLARSENVRKVSRRDLPIVTAMEHDGATTVAATMYIAAAAGIEVFATGGIGGVHRGQPFDISADLPELAATPVTVVCAGAKAILDLSLTLEWLETHGVPVLGYSTDTLPAFYTRSSGLSLDARVDDAKAVAAIVQAKRRIGLGGGILVTVPPPQEHALPDDMAKAAIETALSDAAQRGITGGEITPYLLARIAELTDGQSVTTNIALLKNNATVAAEIAIALCE